MGIKEQIEGARDLAKLNGVPGAGIADPYLGPSFAPPVAPPAQPQGPKGDPAMPPVGPLSQSSEDAHDTAINEALAAAEARRQILPDARRGGGVGPKAEIIPENSDMNRVNIQTAGDTRTGGQTLDAMTNQSAAGHNTATQSGADAMKAGIASVAQQEADNRNTLGLGYAEVQQAQAQRNAAIEQRLKDLETGTKELASRQVSSKKFWANPGNLFSALAASLSPLGSGRMDGQKMIDNMIAQDLADQQAEYDHAKGALAEQRTTIGQFRQLAGDAQVGDQLLLAQKHEEAASHLQEIAALSKIPEVQAAADKAKQEQLDKANALRMSIVDHITRDPSVTKVPGMKAATLAGREVRGVAGSPTGPNFSLQPFRDAYKAQTGVDMPPELEAKIVEARNKNVPPPPRANNLEQVKADAKAAEQPDVISGPRGTGPVTQAPAGPVTSAPGVPSAQAQGKADVMKRAGAAIGAKGTYPGDNFSGSVDRSKSGAVVTTLPTQKVAGSAEEGKADKNQQFVKDREAKAKNVATRSLSVAKELLDEEAYRRMGIKWSPGQPQPALSDADLKHWEELRRVKEEEALNDKQKIANKLHDLKWYEANQGYQDIAEAQAQLLAQFGGDPHKVEAFLGPFRETFGRLGEELYNKGAATGLGERDRANEAAYKYLHKVAMMAQQFRHEQAGSAVNAKEAEKIEYLTDASQPFLDQVNSNNQFRQVLNSKYQGAMKISKDGIGAMLYQGTAGLGKVYKAGDMTPHPVGKPK